MRAVVVMFCLGAGLLGQRWQDTCGKTRSGQVELLQAVKDAGSDTLVLIVASHPDDRYVLPASWLRYCHGARVAVLLATRGGGGQNSLGPETGDAFERIRTLETEAGCARFDGQVWYLDRPDGGYRRTAEEAFAEWGRDGTLHDLVRLVRRIRPDVVMTTHHAEEAHGHDLALVALLPRAIELSNDPGLAVGEPPHRVRAFLLGAGSTSTPQVVNVSIDQLEPIRGQTLGRLAYDVLREAHRSPGAPAALETLFEPDLRLEPQFLGERNQESQSPAALPFGRMPSLFDAGVWPGTPESARLLEDFLGRELPLLAAQPGQTLPRLLAAHEQLRELATGAPPGSELHLRAQRRLESIARLLLQVCNLHIEVDVPPGTVAVGGEELVATVHLYAGDSHATTLRAEGLDGLLIELDTLDGRDLQSPSSGPIRANATIKMPLRAGRGGDPMQARFHSERFAPPVRIRFVVGISGVEVSTVLALPVEERAPVELSVVPRMLLLPTERRAVQFSVEVVRNTQFPVEDDLEVKAPAGYVIHKDRRQVTLREQRGDLFDFEVLAPTERKPGVDVLRITLGGTRIGLPVHKVDVKIPPSLRIGVVRSRDDTLVGILGFSGLGLSWSELSDADLAIADLQKFDTIVVDVRSLRDRPAARRSFRRLLEFAEHRGKRLLVFYQKDIEFNPPGEGFLGAPTLPFQVGKGRVTRADAPVRLLRAQHVLLNFPNVIRPGDWDGWEQERGLYFPSIYGPGYQEILEMHDPGQPPERGSLLFATTGEGEYVYCALSLWRQLKKLHPGAVRLLANLLTPGGLRHK